ncbi:MAG: hypothetical protein Q8L76_16605 [Cypionkella sp.]|uniref:hypothetical protein n=1 Tax=Cypionkella sp. TaxID=2811411 RepID=UPI00272F2884|nr:hypothetical protein [Cypionkella sp.]MDP1578349.1 hypothetical protein [Cypionkella sp.]MDP2047939.1 hypothetical protein [Cypionkella sp.]
MNLTDLTFTVSEVASLTDEKVETVKTWRKRGYFTFEKSAAIGWQRFSWDELFSIAVFSEVIGSVGSHELAGFAGGIAPQMADEIRTASANPYFIGAKHRELGLHSEVVYGADGISHHLRQMLSAGKCYGCYVVVDYASIMQRLSEKFTKISEEA